MSSDSPDSYEQLRSLLRFAEFAAQADQRLDLATGALLIAGIAYPSLDAQPTLRQLDELADLVRADLRMSPGTMLAAGDIVDGDVAELVLMSLRKVLGDQEGFRGNREDYYDPRNSFLSDVVRRRTGLPITLSLVYIEVARRIGAPLVGVGLPAHFVAKWPLGEDGTSDLFIDPFASGMLMDFSQCRRFVLRLMSASAGGTIGPIVDARWFAPVGTRAFLTRMLLNLKQVYLHRGDTAHALAVVERLVMLCPDQPDELRDRGLLRLAAGETLLAAADINAYIERAPDAPDIGRLRRRLAECNDVRAKRN